jgi:drug/metabolite transporter superfamily protein YnfA
METVKDLTSTTFGYVIGFVLPGLVLLLGMASLSGASFELSKMDATMGYSVLVLLVAITASMLLSAVRFVTFEKLLCAKYKLEKNLFSKLVEARALDLFRAVVDEHYRYHQFFGGTFFALFVAYAAFLERAALSLNATVGTAVCFIGLQMLMVYSAKDSYEKFVKRSNAILDVSGRRLHERLGLEEERRIKEEGYQEEERATVDTEAEERNKEEMTNGWSDKVRKTPVTDPRRPEPPRPPTPPKPPAQPPKKGS